MNGTSYKSFAAVQENCAVREEIDDYGIESWLKSAKSLYKRAQIAEDQGQLVDAYIYYSKTYEICYTGIPSHHRYAQWKAAPASQEACQEYRTFRLHLQSEMDHLVRLQKKIKSFFASRRLSEAPRPMDRAVESVSSPPRLTTTDAVAARLAKLGNLSATPAISQDDHPVPKNKPNGARPLIPKTLTMEPSQILKYLSDYPSLEMLFLDVRPQNEYIACHIEAKIIVNVDPIVCRPDLSSQDIEDALAIGLDEHLALFEKRHEFDLLVMYDQTSRTLLASEAERTNHYPEALQNLHRALWERMGWRKPLIRSPVLLIGGIDKWISLGGSVVGSDSRRESHESRTKSILVQQPSDSTSYLTDKKKHRSTSVVQAAEPSYPRSVDEYIFANTSNGRQSMVRSLDANGSPTKSSSPQLPPPSTLDRRPRPLSISSPRAEHGPYLEKSQLPDKSQRPGGAPVYLRQPSVGSQSSRLGQTSIGKTGLKNLGNSCFMNAVLQCLAACFPLARYFTSGQWRADVSLQNPLGYKGNIAKEFAKVLRELSSDDNSVVAPVDLRNELGKTRPEFANNEQQDAQELLNFLLDAIHEDLNAHATKPQLRELTEEEEFYRETLAQSFVSETEWKRYSHRNMSIITKLFQGQLQSRLKCLTCGHTSTTYNAFSTLSLPIPPKRSAVHLADCINEFVKAEGMTGDDSWFCSKCKTTREATKKLSISRLPDVMIVHFKRFESKGPWRDKLNTEISFPLTGLDMTSYLGSNLQTTSAVKSIYDIFGIVYHRGSMEGGHYTAMVNPNAQREGWTLFDDSRVAPNDEIDKRASYLLFYAKRSSMM